jgi:RHS repeat-associated protein
VTQRRYDSFGNLRWPFPGSWPGTRGFVGGTVDSTTGFTNLGAREYDPGTGRFLSVDPVLETDDPQQMNGYSYAANNPVTFSDPTGLMFPAGYGHFSPAPAPRSTGRGHNGGAHRWSSPAWNWLPFLRMPWHPPMVHPPARPKPPPPHPHQHTHPGPSCGFWHWACAAGHWIGHTASAGVHKALGLGRHLVLGVFHLGLGILFGVAHFVLGILAGLAHFAMSVAVGWVHVASVVAGTVVGGGVGRPKPVNLPAWRHVKIDMGHILSGHTAGGSRVSSKKDLFPESMTPRDIQSTVRNAYRHGERVRSQGDNVLVVGPGPAGTRMRIAMWLNRRTRTIETAWPFYG